MHKLPLSPLFKPLFKSLYLPLFNKTFVTLFEWTPNFNPVNSYGQLTSAFAPTGAGTTLLGKGVYKSDGGAQQLLAPDTSTFVIATDSSNVVSFNLIANVTINGVAATSGVTVLANGYYELLGDLDSTADIDVIMANASFGANSQTQFHYLLLTDPLDSSNSLEIDTVIRSETMPTGTELFNKLNGLKVGDLINLGSAQPYVPQIKGGAQNRQFEVLKSEEYGGDLNNTGFTGGVDVQNRRFNSNDGGNQKASWAGSGVDFIDSILVSNSGAVVKGISTNTSSNNIGYEILLGDNVTILEGFRHPNVFRVLKPDAVGGSEYKHFNDGGTWPWVE
jgi:hypothetical protein